MDIRPIESKLLHSWLGYGSINIFGRPFSGKDTQAKKFAEFLNCPVLGGGEIIRQANNNLIDQQIKSGLLAPQKEYLALVLPFLDQAKYQNKPLILNSFGRWHGEEKVIMQSAIKAKHPIKAVIYLDISEQLVYQRWQKANLLKDRGFRKDDNQASIKTRLQEFKTKTLPVIKYYNQQKLLIVVNGNQTRQQVTSEIIQKLLARTKNKF